jgi:5'-nucleotidase
VNVLVVNDDGITAPGLWALAAELKQIAEVVVVAPDRQQTGVGTSMTLDKPLKVSKVKPRVKGIDAYSVKGTPADSVIVGTFMPGLGIVDLVVSGINEGPNMGKDVLVSGTVGAALQAHNRGLPALAISLADIADMNFEVAARLAAILAQQISSGILSGNALLNVNVPNIPLTQIEGIDITRLGDSGYTPGFAVKESNDSASTGRWHYRMIPGSTEVGEEQGTDIWAVRQNRISITPIHNRLTCHEGNEHLPTMCSRLSQELSGGNIVVMDHLKTTLDY